MSRMIRILTISGLGLVAGVTMSAGPAMASTASGQSATQPAAATSAARFDDDVVDYYDTRRQCERAGRVGEWRDRWDDYDCDYVGGGRHRGDWALTVDDDDWGSNWDRGGWDRWDRDGRWGRHHRH